MLLLVVLAMIAAACSSDDSGDTTETTTAGTETTQATETTAAGGDEEGGTLQVVRYESFDGWVLDSAAAWASYQSHLAVIEPLLRFGADGTTLEPGLATEWDYDPDALTITFTLRDNARFSNGDPVTVDDVAFSADVWKAGPNFGVSFASITEVTGEGQDVVIHLAGPDNTLLPFLSSSIAGIMPKDFAGMTEDEFYANPIGAGPFKVDEWSTGGRIVLSRNEFYYDPDRPYVDEVVIDVVADETERQLLFDGGQADIVEYLALTAASRYDPANVYACAAHRVEHVGLNVNHPPLDDTAVRQAIAFAIDYQAISDTLGEHATLPSGIVAPNVINWAPPTKPYYRRDLDKAKELISGSSGADGATLQINYDSGLDEDALIAQILKSNLAEIGIDVQIQGLETLAFLDSAFSLESDMTIWNYGAVSPDVSDPLSWIMATEWLFSGYETDTLLDQFFAYAEAATPEEDQAIVAQIQDEAIDEAAAIAIMEGSFLHGVNPDLNGFWAAPWGLYYYDTIQLGS
jgi:peptide/nickel transport system substrate-binding protein